VRELQQTLIEIGLSENEASVYLASLGLGPAAVQPLSRAASIKRTTAYSVVESLLQQGIMRLEIRGRKKLYAAEPPSKLYEMIERKRERLRQSLGELSTLYDFRSGEASIKYYEGVEALKAVYNGLLQDCEAGKDYLIFSSPKEWYQLAPQFFDDFLERRKKIPLKMRYMMIDSEIARRIKRDEESLGRKIKLLPKTMSFTANLVIIPRKVVINQLVPPVWAAVIENRYIVNTFIELYNVLWEAIPGEENSTPN
jgi:sugar-specific transcriptional regulator TrmB